MPIIFWLHDYSTISHPYIVISTGGTIGRACRIVLYASISATHIISWGTPSHSRMNWLIFDWHRSRCRMHRRSVIRMKRRQWIKSRRYVDNIFAFYLFTLALALRQRMDRPLFYSILLPDLLIVCSRPFVIIILCLWSKGNTARKFRGGKNICAGCHTRKKSSEYISLSTESNSHFKYSTQNSPRHLTAYQINNSNYLSSCFHLSCALTLVIKLPPTSISNRCRCLSSRNRRAYEHSHEIHEGGR